MLDHESGDALRRSEERLRQAEERLRLMEASVRDHAILYTDSQGVVTFWSKGAEQVFGYAEREIIGQDAAVLFTPEDREGGAPERELSRAAETGRGEDERWHLRKGGGRVFLSGVVTPIRDRSGGLLGFAKVARDITERKLHEAELRGAGERHRTILESITDGFFALGRDWRFTYINPQGERILGRRPGELLGRSLWEEYPGLAGSEFERAYRRAAEERVAVSFTSYYPDHDRWYEVRTYPSEDGLSVYFQDITERKRREAEHDRLVAESERQRRTYETALSSTPDFNYIFDLEGRFTFVNAALLDLWRKRLDEAVGRDFFQLGYPPELAARLRRQIRQVVETKRPVRDETPFTSHLGERQYEYIFVPVLGAGGAVEAVAGSTRDITERRRHEEAWRAAKDEAERANQAKDHFLAVLSHELRTPLNPILLAASSMLERTPEPEEVRPTLEMIRQNVKLQARLIDDLLDVMRIVQGKMPLHWGVADCHALIGQSIDICRSEFLGKAQELVLDLAAEDHHVNADSARLHQVLWNLVRNAVKFTPEGGRVAVRTRNEDDGGRNVVIEVVDTGIGIEPHVLPTVFDPFQQGETTITRRFGGLGLGLAICKGVVDAHGGTLAVESQGLGRGTTFRVTLKTMPEPEAVPDGGGDGEGQPPPSLNRLNILVVEDEAATLRLMARLLKGLGHRVTAAGTVADAWGAFQAGDFDLIVSDIGLPDGTGLDLMRRVKALRRVPSIALTGYGMDEDVRRSREAGFTTHMTKPIDFTKLEAMIRQVAD